MEEEKEVKTDRERIEELEKKVDELTLNVYKLSELIAKLAGECGRMARILDIITDVK